jgi:competence protein ComEC
VTIDLRLVPAALAAWLTGWALTAGPTASGAPSAVVAVAVGGVVLALAALVGLRRRRSAVAHAVLVLACVAAVALSVQVHAAGRAPLERLGSERATAVLRGRVASDPRPAAFGTGERWTLDVEAVSARSATSAVRARVEVTASTPAPAYGSRVELRARLAPGEPVAAEVARASASDPPRVVHRPPGVLRGATALRAALMVVTSDLSPQAQGLVPGIAVGDTTRLPDDLRAAFRTTGLTHLTAVSGGHFAIVLALVTTLSGLLRAPRALRVGVVAAVAVGFVLLVRPEPSVLRAAAMCAVTLTGVALGRPAASVPSLAACASVLLIGDPWLSRSYGFALSCAATAGLVLLAPPLVRRLTPWLGQAGGFAVAVPLAAQAACGPVIVLLTPTVSLTSVPANLLAAPAVVPATLLGLAATVTAPWWPLGAHALAWLAGGATWWIAAVARACAGIPGAAMPWPGGAPGALALLAATAAVVVLVLRRAPMGGWPRAWTDGGRRATRELRTYGRAGVARYRAGMATRRDRWVAAVVLGAVLAVVAGTTAAVRLSTTRSDLPADWQVVACDVGQGDSLVVRTGPAAAIVVDTGPDGDASGRCLDRLGVTRIDLLVLTHFHADHVGGLAAVLAGRDVRAAWTSALREPALGARRAATALADDGVPVRVPETGESGRLGEGSWGVRWRVLGTGLAGGGSPSSGAHGVEGDGVNDASLAVELVSTSASGTLEVVALGDLERPGQEALLASVGSVAEVADGVDVVKVAHHGSASQSGDLARLLHPRVALVSVGAGNTYGHPTASMLDLYASMGATTVRTDRCGTAVLVVRAGTLGLACT